jgi:hypothetical protein
VKIYIDENISIYLAKGLHLLEQPNNHGFEILSIKEVFGEGVADETWIPKIGSEKGIVISQDYNIYRIRSQRELIFQHGLGIFFIIPPGKSGYTYWEIVKYSINHWEEIKKKSNETLLPFAFKCPCRGKIEQIL